MLTTVQRGIQNLQVKKKKRKKSEQMGIECTLANIRKL